MRVCLLTVAGHRLHLLSLEAFEKGEDMETSQDCFESLPGPFVRSQKSCKTSSLFKKSYILVASLHTFVKSGPWC